MPDASDPTLASAHRTPQKPDGGLRPGIDEVRTAVVEIDVAVHNLWNSGQNIVVGWRPEDGGIQVCFAPCRTVFEKAARYPRLLEGARLMDRTTFARVCKEVRARVLDLPLAFPVADENTAGGIDPSLIDSVICRYSILRTEHRAVMLFDIADFATASPVEQLAQFISLEHSISAVGQAMNEAGLPVELARSTAGDGCIYVWNRHVGLEADLRAYAAMLLILASNARARRAAEADGGIVPVLRTAFTVGSHYSYHQMEANRPRTLEYATGQVTIALARVVGKALDGQVLLGAFTRPIDRSGNTVEAAVFIARAERLLASLAGAAVDEHKLKELRSLLCGEVQTGNDFGITRYLIQDKHGFRHEVFNLRGKANWTESGMIEFGRRADDLAGFDAATSQYQLSGAPTGHAA